MKRNSLFTIILIVAGGVFYLRWAICSLVRTEPNASGNISEPPPVAHYPNPVGALFANEDYTYFIEHVTEPCHSDAFMAAGYNDSSSIVIHEYGTALVAFVNQPTQIVLYLDRDPVTHFL